MKGSLSGVSQLAVAMLLARGLAGCGGGHGKAPAPDGAADGVADGQGQAGDGGEGSRNDGGSDAAPDGDSAVGDGAGGANLDGGVEVIPGCTAPSVAGTAAMSADGAVLTNRPTLRFTKTAGDFQITTAYLTILTGVNMSAVQVWGDLRNTSTSQVCVPLSDSFLIESQVLGALVDGPAHKGPIGTSQVCVDPGATVSYRALASNVAINLLDTATTVSYAFSGVTPSTTAVLHPDDPQLVSAAPTEVTLGWALAGQLRAGASTIHNLEVLVLARDPNGLLYEDTSAFPATLGNIAPGTLIDFQTYALPAKFCAYVRYDAFAEGATAALEFADGDPAAARSAEAARRREAMRAARARLAR